MSVGTVFMDALTELVGLGVGKAGDVLNAMLESHISLSAPSIRIIAAEDLTQAVAESVDLKLASVEMRYSGSMDGIVMLVFPAKDAGKLVDAIVGDNAVQEEGLDAIRAGTLCEIGNIVINAIVGTISNQLGLDLSYTIPFYREDSAAVLIANQPFKSGTIILLIETRFVVENLEVAGTIAVFLSVLSYGKLEKAMERYTGIPS